MSEFINRGRQINVGLIVCYGTPAEVWGLGPTWTIYGLGVPTIFSSNKWHVPNKTNYSKFNNNEPTSTCTRRYTAPNSHDKDCWQYDNVFVCGLNAYKWHNTESPCFVDATHLFSFSSWPTFQMDPIGHRHLLEKQMLFRLIKINSDYRSATWWNWFTL